MTFGEMQAIVADMCGNMKAGHPLYKYITGHNATDGDTPCVINMAANRFVRMVPQRLPEMRASWLIGPTVAGNNTVALPSDLLIVHEVKSFHSPTSPDVNVSRTFPVVYKEPAEFDILTKDSTVTDWPRIVTKIGKSVKVWPTPSADFVDYLHWFGIMEEAALVSDSDTLFTHPDWHPLVCRLAASLLEEMRMNYDGAATLLASVKTELGDSRDIVAEENITRTMTASVEGAPTRATVYGR